ncbi:hypothetical protein TWF481_001824 [Arthrobotrys musiformis]|uniref:Uncharacterized protein n=1 Tax=Arthrobotrys musiformis TaxID=47236 RepID=A0AAV9W0G6_9PEZI
MPLIEAVGLLIIGGIFGSVVTIAATDAVGTAATVVATTAAEVAVSEAGTVFGPAIGALGTGAMLSGVAGCGLATAALGAVGVQIYKIVRGGGGDERSNSE